MVSCKMICKWLKSFVAIIYLWGLYFIQHIAQIIIPKHFAFLKYDSNGDSALVKRKRNNYRKVIHSLINQELCKQYPQKNNTSSVFQNSHNKLIKLQNLNEQNTIAMLSQELQKMKKNLQVHELKTYKILLEIKYSLLSYEVKVSNCDMKSPLLPLTQLKNEYYNEASITEQFEMNVRNTNDFIHLDNISNEHDVNSVNVLKSFKYNLYLKSRMFKGVSHRGLKILHKSVFSVPARMKLKISDIDDVLRKNQIQLYRPAVVGENLSFINTNLCESENRAEVAVYRDRSGSSELTGSQESSSTLASQADSDHEDGEATPRHKAVVVRWHSFQRGSCRPESCLVQPEDPEPHLRPMGALSCGQLLVLRKLSLLKLTAFMERFCPTHRTGWNWELPKFIRKIKTPDYKDKSVFGIPLLLTLQRTGQALPCCIQQALKWLRANALDQVGLFRKSGVRSRIQKLKVMTETQGTKISYDGQQAYDVADMVKQYFRELPEALLTNKLSETFIAIFQHVPESYRAEAVQWVLLLLPDEHREALQTLLEFLSQVAAHAEYNQMSPSNLAVCLAPSLFHFHHAPSGATSGRSASASPRRRKTVGVPDARELAENRAAHDCLLYLIKEHKSLFMVSEEILAQCHFNYMEESIPVALEELGSEFQQDWRGYLYACTTALLKEAREKSRGWVSVTCSSDPQVEMAYKKVGDGHPLRLWRVSTEVEAPPQELLHRVLRGRHVWDNNLLKWRVVARPDPQGEVFQYVCASMPPLPAKDYCVLRSWRTDLPKGACVIVETSVEHADAPVMLGGVRGIVLASRYLIEPCGSGKSRIMHLSRVDTKGRTPDWYNKSYGHICALYLSLIRGSFKHNTDGPESKV